MIIFSTYHVGLFFFDYFFQIIFSPNFFLIFFSKIVSFQNFPLNVLLHCHKSIYKLVKTLHQDIFFFKMDQVSEMSKI